MIEPYYHQTIKFPEPRGPLFDWVDVLHALSLGLPLSKGERGWAFDKSDVIIAETEIADLKARGLVSGDEGSVQITVAGKQVLNAEIDAIIARTAEWLKTIPSRWERSA